MSANVEAFTSWSTTLTNNQPTSTDTADLVSDLTKIQAEVRKYTRTVATPMASATTLNLATADGDYVAVTGTTTITGLGTVSAGIRFILKFDGALTFTHNATSLILPGAANITTAANDIAIMESLGSGNWRCLHYQKASGLPVAFIDEDTMATNSAVLVPSQQSVKAYVDGTTSLASNGYQKFSNGLIIQWMAQVVTNSVAAYNYPIEFPTACLAVFAGNANDNTSIVFAGLNSTTQYNAYANNSGASYYFLAIGH